MNFLQQKLILTSSNSYWFSDSIGVAPRFLWKSGSLASRIIYLRLCSNRAIVQVIWSHFRASLSRNHSQWRHVVLFCISHWKAFASPSLSTFHWIFLQLYFHHLWQLSWQFLFLDHWSAWGVSTMLVVCNSTPSLFSSPCASLWIEVSFLAISVPSITFWVIVWTFCSLIHRDPYSL